MTFKSTSVVFLEIKTENKGIVNNLFVREKLQRNWQQKYIKKVTIKFLYTYCCLNTFLEYLD